MFYKLIAQAPAIYQVLNQKQQFQSKPLYVSLSNIKTD